MNPAAVDTFLSGKFFRISISAALLGAAAVKKIPGLIVRGGGDCMPDRGH
jgi:hypothetical protein